MEHSEWFKHPDQYCLIFDVQKLIERRQSDIRSEEEMAVYCAENEIPYCPVSAATYPYSLVLLPTLEVQEIDDSGDYDSYLRKVFTMLDKGLQVKFSRRTRFYEVKMEAFGEFPRNGIEVLDERPLKHGSGVLRNWIYRQDFQFLRRVKSGLIPYGYEWRKLNRRERLRERLLSLLLPSLHDAARYNYFKLARRLKSQGAELDVRNENGDTPLLLAMRYENKEMANYLIQSNAGAKLASYGDWTPLMSACLHGWNSLVAKMNPIKIDIDYYTAGDQTALMVAACIGQDECIKLLLERGANPKLIEFRGYDALMLAVANCTNETIQLLISKGSDPMLVSRDGFTAADLARKHGKTDILKTIKNAVA